MTLSGNVRSRQMKYNKYRKLMDKLNECQWDIKTLISNKILKLRDDGFVDWIDDGYAGIFNVYREPFKMNYVKYIKDDEGNIQFRVNII